MNFAPLSANKIANALAGRELGHEVYVLEEIPSTNDHVKELGHLGYPHGLVVYAESQTAGRGRRDNAWSSEIGEDILHSILFRPNLPLELWPRLTTIAALAIAAAVEKFLGLEPQIKWPNDLYLHHKKFVGILAETFVGENAFMVLGVGINVNRKGFSEELSKTATSLWIEKGRPNFHLDRERLAIAILQELNVWIKHWNHGFSTVIEEVSKRSWLLGKTIRAFYQEKEVIGTVLGLNAEGHLQLQTQAGQIISLSSAEQVRPI